LWSNSARTNEPARTLQPTATPAPTARVTPTPAPTNTVPIVVTATPTPSVARSSTPPTTPLPTPSAVATDDHGNTPQTATALTPGTLYNGTIDPATDVDWFRFNAVAGNQIVAEYRGKTLNAGAIALYVLNAAAGSGVTEVGVEDIDNGSGASIAATARETAVYFIRVRSSRTDVGTYTLIVGATSR